MRDTLVSATSIQKTVGNLFSIRLLIGVISDLVATKRALLVSALTHLYAFVRFSSDSGDEGIRTPDPLLARQVLSQLSYTPKGFLFTCMDFLLSI